MPIAWASRAKRSAKAGSRAISAGGSSTPRAIQVLLPGLVDHAHSAEADRVRDFQVGEQIGQLLRRGGVNSPLAWPASRGGGAVSIPRFGRQPGHSPCGGMGRPRGSTFGTSVLFAHGTAPTLRTVYPYYKELAGKVFAQGAGILEIADSQRLSGKW